MVSEKVAAPALSNRTATRNRGFGRSFGPGFLVDS